MAIITGIPGLKVAIRVNQVELQEYQDPDEGENTPSRTIKYIQATSGAYFDVFVKLIPGEFKRTTSDISIDVYVDGTCVNRPILRLNCNSFTYGTPRIIEGAYNGSGQDWKLHRFQFSQLDIGEFNWTAIFRNFR